VPTPAATDDVLSAFFGALSKASDDAKKEAANSSQSTEVATYFGALSKAAEDSKKKLDEAKTAQSTAAPAPAPTPAPTASVTYSEASGGCRTAATGEKVSGSDIYTMTNDKCKANCTAQLKCRGYEVKQGTGGQFCEIFIRTVEIAHQAASTFKSWSHKYICAIKDDK
jgi:hypothetical protein